MIVGSVVHNGHDALAAHLTDLTDNERIDLDTAGLVSRDAVGALAELRRLSAGARTKAPLIHVWASPSREYLPDEWDVFWSAYEAEFSLTGQPYFEVSHHKMGAGGRTVSHRHRVYLRVQPNGRAVSMSHSAPRNEKVARISEVRNGERLTPGVFSRSVVRHLRRDGMHDVASVLERSGGELVARTTTISSVERAEQVRTGDIPADAVASHVVRILSSARSGAVLASALLAVGLHPARGEKTIGVVTPLGRFYPLARTHNRMAKANGLMSLKAAEVEFRFAGVDLPAVTDVVNSSSNVQAPAVGADRRDRTSNIEGQQVACGGSIPHTPTEHLSQALPLSSASSDPNASWLDVKPIAIDVSILTNQQRAAVQEWEDKLFAARSSSAEPSKEPESVVGVHEAGSVSQSSSSAHYKARLASLPEELGPTIRWVDRRDQGATVHLHDGCIVLLEPRRSSASAETPDALAVMIAHAHAQGWSPAVVKGGSRACREALARGLVRAGLAPSGDPVVQRAALDERDVIVCEEALGRWRSAQRSFLIAKTARSSSTQGSPALRALLAASNAVLKNDRAKAMLTREESWSLEADSRFASGVLGERDPQVGWRPGDKDNDEPDPFEPETRSGPRI